MEDINDPDDLLNRYLRNETSEEESEFVKQWLVRLDLSEENVSLQQMSAIKAAMYERITGEKSIRKIGIWKKMKRMPAVQWAAAACLFVVLASGAAYWLSGRKPDKTIPAGLVKELNSGKAPRRLLLKDGTTVWLNIGSSLTYYADFDQRERRIRLEGEGYFEVATDGNRPFIVSMDNIDTRVLGTAFNIESYPGESEIRVSLVQGKVQVNDQRRPGEQIVLSPNETMRYGRADGHWEQLSLDAGHDKDWTTGSIVFNEVPLAEALHRIAARYNIHIQYPPEILSGKRVTTLLRGDHWPSVLSNILFVHHLHYTESNGLITIKQ